MAHIRPSAAPAPASGPATAEDSGAEQEQEEEITHFAPFGAQKPTRSAFLRSSEYESEFSESKSDSKEIEFQESEAQSVTSGAKVLFRKLKAAVSGSSASVSSSSQEVTGSNLSSNNSPGLATTQPQRGSSHAPLSEPVSGGARGGGGSGHMRSGASPTPSFGNSMASGTGVSAVDQLTSDPGGLTMSTAEQALSEETKISLTSYSDAHKIRKTPGAGASGGNPSGGGVAGGMARPQAQAVNKTEMLKRFGSIADNKGVQVHV